MHTDGNGDVHTNAHAYRYGNAVIDTHSHDATDSHTDCDGYLYDDAECYINSYG